MCLSWARLLFLISLESSSSPWNPPHLPGTFLVPPAASPAPPDSVAGPCSTAPALDLVWAGKGSGTSGIPGWVGWRGSLLRHSPRSRQVLLSPMFRGLWEQPGSPAFLWDVARMKNPGAGNCRVLWERCWPGKHGLTLLPPSRGIIPASPSRSPAPGLPPACSEPGFWQRTPFGSPCQGPSWQGILLRPAQPRFPNTTSHSREHPGELGLTPGLGAALPGAFPPPLQHLPRCLPASTGAFFFSHG